MRLLATLLIVPVVSLTAATSEHTIVAYRDLLLVTAPAPSAQLPPGVARQRLSVDFRDTPLSEVAELLRRATGLNVVVAPALLAADRGLTFTARDMELGHLLGWIRTVAAVHVGWVDGALFIADQPPRAAQVTRAYDVGDLTMTVRDFPGPELAIPRDAGGAAVIAPADERPAPTAEDLVSLIETVIGQRPGQP